MSEPLQPFPQDSAVARSYGTDDSPPIPPSPCLPSPSSIVLHRSSFLSRARSASMNVDSIFRRLSWYLLPIFFLLNILNYLDRANLAFASIQMSQDIDLSTSQYGVGSGLFFIGYSVFQLPSQIILRHIGAPKWLAVIVTIWGITASCMAAVTDAPSFYIVRLMLGFAEAGSFPGYWYYLTRFYPDKHIILPYAITDSAIMVAQVLGAPIAAGLLQLNGMADLRGWQWLFLAEGIPTLLLGICFPFLLPSEPADIKFLPREETNLIQEEVSACRLDSQHGFTTWQLLWMAVTHPFNYMLGAVKLAKDFVAYGCMFWAPMLIRGLLHKHNEGGDSCSAWEGPKEDDDDPDTGMKEVLLTGIPYTLAAMSSVLVAWNSQRTKERKWHICIAYAIGGGMLLALPAASEHSIVLGFIVLCSVIVAALCPNGVLLALASRGGQGPAMPLNLAVFNSVGNIAGLFGPWIIGVVVSRTCSYDMAFYIMGGVLLVGSGLVHLVDDAALQRLQSSNVVQKTNSFRQLELPSQQSSVQDSLYTYGQGPDSLRLQHQLSHSDVAQMDVLAEES